MAKKIKTPAWDRASALERHKAEQAVKAKYAKPDMKISDSPKVKGESMSKMIEAAKKNEKTRGKGGGYFKSK